MKHSTVPHSTVPDAGMKTKDAGVSSGGFSERELRHSGVPVKGELGEAKYQVWALSFGLFVLALMLAFAFLDYMPK